MSTSEYRVLFEADLVVELDDEARDNSDDAAQAVQNAIGHTGAVVVEILDVSSDDTST